MPIALLELLSQPQNSLGTHLCAKVSVKGCWSASLQSIKDRQAYHRLHCNIEETRTKSVPVFSEWIGRSAA